MRIYGEPGPTLCRYNIIGMKVGVEKHSVSRVIEFRDKLLRSLDQFPGQRAGRTAEGLPETPE